MTQPDEPHSVSAVLLDTSILLQDPLLAGAHLRKLLEACKTYGIEVVVPEVVRDELYGNHRQRLTRALQKVQKEQKELHHNLVDKPLAFTCNIDEEHQKYREYLEAVLESFDVQNAPYPPMTAQQLVLASYEGKKPFKQQTDSFKDNPQKDGGSDGYKDLLVFHSFLAVVKENQEDTVALITANTKNFCDPHGQMHPDLVAVIPKGAEVMVLSSAKAFYEAIIQPLVETYTSLEDAASLENAITEGRYPGFDLQDKLRAELVGTLEDSSGVDLTDVTSVLDEATVAGVGEHSVETFNVSSIGEGKLVLDVEGTVELKLSGFIEKWEYFGDVDSYKKLGVSVADGSWNDFVVLAEMEMHARFSLTVVIDRATQQVSSADISLMQSNANDT